jgi:hypothetical protein
MQSKRPLTILTENGPVKNYAARVDEINAEWLREWIAQNNIVEALQSELTAKGESIDAHRIVIADFQKSLNEANLELGHADPITRNRSTFLKLLQETFSIRIGFVSVNVQKFGQLLRFIYQQPAHKS